jgi:2-polyprenyl-3-methyl-5-hydroxy-6-metoxy-1,4-benzoquinol methylase
MMMDSNGNETGESYRGWEYARIGDYHRNLDLNWSYAPTYLRKMKWVREYLETLSNDARILDAGCGEGVLVEEYTNSGLNIEGLDLNYSSEFVRRGDIRQMPYEDRTFDVVLLLDVFEHVAYAEQSQVLQEIHRVLKPRGQLVASIPNLAHLSSRFSFSLLGRLQRTDSELNHIGERPYIENRHLLLENGFTINRCVGVTLTVPLLYKLISHYAARLRWLHDLLEPLAIPSLAMLNLFFCHMIDLNVDENTA